MARYTRVHRLLKIITLLRGGGDWNTVSLGRELGQSSRNAKRDIDQLNKAGIPIHYDSSRRRYRVGGDFFLPPVELTLEESLALVWLGETSGTQGKGLPLRRAAGMALHKVRSALPTHLRDELESTEPVIEVQGGPAEDESSLGFTFQEVSWAIRQRRCLVCRYLAAKSDQPDSRGAQEFDLEPYRLFFSQRAWYVVGLHGGRDDKPRTLRLARLSVARRTARAYAIPASFSLASHLGAAWRLIPGKRANISVRFNAAFAASASQTRWHASQREVKLPDGGCELHFEVDGLDEIKWWILSYGPGAEVISPPELRAEVRRLAVETAQVYGP